PVSSRVVPPRLTRAGLVRAGDVAPERTDCQRLRAPGLHDGSARVARRGRARVVPPESGAASGPRPRCHLGAAWSLDLRARGWRGLAPDSVSPGSRRTVLRLG